MNSKEVDFSEVKGQYQVKRAIEVAAAGRHQILLIGPVGAGKSVLAKRIPTILPPMTPEEAAETTKIHSLCGLLGEGNTSVASRPFRSPHHTIIDISLLGGSANPTPGEVSLAHNGVLFLDELPEFKPKTLEALGQMMEDGGSIAGTTTFPADFMLVTGMNPCPCSYFGDPARECRCSPGQVEKYRSQISGLLLDLIDIHVDAPAVNYKELSSNEPAEPSAAIRERVIEARSRQRDRFSSGKKTNCNARMDHSQIKKFCALDPSGQEMLRHAMEDLQLSAHARDGLLKVARTIADLAGVENIQPEHIGEANHYRVLDRKL